MDDDSRPKKATLLEARGVLQHEVDYRRQRRWSIFTWANTTLVAIIGGSIALQVQADGALSLPQRALMSIAVLILVAYACLWWEAQRRIGSGLRSELAKLDARLDVPVPTNRGGVPDRVGGLYTIALLGLAAIAAIWLPPR